MSLVVRGSQQTQQLSISRLLDNTLLHGNKVFGKLERSTLRHHSHSTIAVSTGRESARIGEAILTTKHGHDILLDPLLNKGTAFPLNERERFGIRGLVPAREYPDKKLALEHQVRRIMNRYFELSSPISKYAYMIALQDRNETLFYRCLTDYIDELAPIIYTPTVGLACQSFGALFRRPRGMYFSSNDRGVMQSMVYNWPLDDVEIIVVTDGSRILGLGDLGTNGMGIPIGKLSLYVAAAGIHPSRTLPVVIDVGTNNEALLNDVMYLGLPQKRVTGKDYFDIVDEFMRAMRLRYPRALIHFEDFSNDKATALLRKYRNRVLCFNDDIQGTGCVVTAALISALRSLGLPSSALKDQRIVLVGAGSAGIGVASAIKFAMIAEGLTKEQAAKRFWMLDHLGTLGTGRTQVSADQEDWMRPEVNASLDLTQLINTVKPTILIGLSGAGGVFSESAIRSMASHVERPIIFPLSNPTSKSECTAEQAYEWTNGKAVFASGSPFDPVKVGDRTLIPCQANNMYAFPGIGLGALVCQARSISDDMVYAAARGLASTVGDEDYEAGRLFPRLQLIQDVSAAVAHAVAKQAAREGLNGVTWSSDEELMELIRERMWDPQHGQMIRVDSV